jgi:hypothetical protein
MMIILISHFNQIKKLNPKATFKRTIIFNMGVTDTLTSNHCF